MADARELAGALVRDWLVRQGFVGTLAALDAELAAAHRAPQGVEQWYAAARALDLRGLDALVRGAAPPGSADDADGGAPGAGEQEEEQREEQQEPPRAALETCVEFLAQRHSSKVLSTAAATPIREAGRAARPGSREKQRSALELSPQSGSESGGKARRGAGSRARRASSLPDDGLDETMALLDQALALEGSVEKDLLTITLETQLNWGRFQHASAGDVSRRRNVAHPSINYPAGTAGVRPQQLQQQQQQQQQQQGQLEPSSPKSPAPRRISSQAGLSVLELSRKLDRVTGGKQSQQHAMAQAMSKPLSMPVKAPTGLDASASACGSASASASASALAATGTGAGDKSTLSLLPGDGALSPEPEEEPGEALAAATSQPSLFGISRQAAALLLSKKNGGLARQREHPATYYATMRVLARDLKVGVTNANMQLQLERAIERGRSRLPATEQQLMQERFCGRRKRSCALCEKSFSGINLPMSISFKAVIDLRDTWGGAHQANSNLARVPTCYDQVKVCHFCSQFFDSVETYRPQQAALKVDDEEAAAAELQRESTEHAIHQDARHESAVFFRRP
jgi:hypothetical protein